MRRSAVWALVALFTVAYWGSSTDPQYPMLLGEFLKGRFSVTNFAASLPIITFSIGACIGTLSAGLLAYRVGVGRLIFISLWGFVLTGLLNSLDANLLMFDLTRFLTGLFQGGLSLLFLLGIGVFVDEEQRGKAVGILSAGAMMAVAAVPLMVMATRDPGDHWRFPFLAFTAAAFVAAIGLHAMRMPARPQTTNEVVAPWPLLRNRTLLCYLALGGLLLVSIVAMGAQFPFFSKDEFGLELHQLIPQMLTLGAGAVTGAVLAGPATDKWGPRQVLVWSSLAVTIFFALVPILARSQWAMYPVFFVMAALGAARVPPYQALMLKVLPENARGPLLGVRNMVSYLGTALGAAGGALCYQFLGGYQAVAIYAAVVSALVLGMIMKTVPNQVSEMRAVSSIPATQPQM